MDAYDDLGTAKKPFNVVAVIPVHGRLELLPLTIKRLYQKNGLSKVICVGDGMKEKAICLESGAMWVPFRNKPLGAKWNAGYRAAKTLSPDAVLYVGSSDWICEDWISIMKPYLEQHHLVGVPGMSLIHVNDTMRACHWAGYDPKERNETIGIGRLISSGILNKIGWSPFDDNKEDSMDGTMAHKCKRLGIKDFFVRDERLKCLSISTDKWTNKHKFDDHYNGKLPSEIIEPQIILNQFPEANYLFNALK